MKSVRVLCALVVAGTALAVAAPAGGANECDGLMVCVPVAGPWVVVPAATGVPRQRVEFQLTCPRGHVVGGDKHGEERHTGDDPSVVDIAAGKICREAGNRGRCCIDHREFPFR